MLGWIALGLLILGCLIGFFSFFPKKKRQKWKKHRYEKSKQELEKIIENEIKYLSHNYYFKNLELRTQCKRVLQDKIILRWSKKGIIFQDSYQKRHLGKIRELTSIINSFIKLDQKQIQNSNLSILKNQNQNSKQKFDYSQNSAGTNLKTTLNDPHFSKVLGPQTESITNKILITEDVFQQLKIRPLVKWNKGFIFLIVKVANEHLSSICQISCLIMKDNQLIFHYQSYVRPAPKYFDEQNVNLHGITMHNVTNAPNFLQVWEKIKNYFNENYIILSDNNPENLDAQALKMTLKYYQIPIPKLKSIDSLQMLWKLHPHTQKQDLIAIGKNLGFCFQENQPLNELLILILVLQKYNQTIDHFYQKLSINKV